MFTKTDAKTALDVVLAINRDDTDRFSSFSMVGPDSILVSIYPHGKSDDMENSWMYSAYKTDLFESSKRIFKHGIQDETEFPTFRQMLDDIKEAAT